MNAVDNELDCPSDRYDIWYRTYYMLREGVAFIDTGTDLLLGTDKQRRNECGFIAIATGLELLFRAKLVSVNWALEFEDVDHPRLEERLTFEKLLTRLCKLQILYRDKFSSPDEDSHEKLFKSLNNLINCRNELIFDGGANEESMLSVATSVLHYLTDIGDRNYIWKAAFAILNVAVDEVIEEEEPPIPPELKDAAQKLYSKTTSIWNNIREKILQTSRRKFIFRCPHCHQSAAYFDYKRSIPDSTENQSRGCEGPNHKNDHVIQFLSCQFCNIRSFFHQCGRRIVRENITNPPVRAKISGAQSAFNDIYKIYEYNDDETKETIPISTLEDPGICYDYSHQHHEGCVGAVLEFGDDFLHSSSKVYVCCGCGKQSSQLKNWKCYSTNADAFEKEINEALVFA